MFQNIKKASKFTLPTIVGKEIIIALIKKLKTPK